jgi:hypothetical protein
MLPIVGGVFSSPRSLTASVARHAAELPTLVLSLAAHTASLVGESAACVRRDGPVAAAQTAARAAVTEVWSFAGRLAPGPGTAAPHSAPHPTPAPAAPGPPSPAARAAGAPGVATPVAEEAAADVARSGIKPNGAALQASDLPLANFDHMTLGSLRGRLRTLSVDDLVVLRAYEEEHARRLQVLTMLENRIARVRAQEQQASRGDGSESA